MSRADLTRRLMLMKQGPPARAMDAAMPASGAFSRLKETAFDYAFALGSTGKAGG